MIPYREKREGKSKGTWHYPAVKKVLALLRGIISKNNDDFCCLFSLHSFRTKDKIESHQNVCGNKDLCNVIMPSGDTKTLEFNQYHKSDKVSFITYADRECIIEKIHGCKNNPENSFLTKVSEHIPSRFSMSAVS